MPCSDIHWSKKRKFFGTIPKRCSDSVCEGTNLVSNNNYVANVSESEVRNVSASASKLDNFFTLNHGRFETLFRI